MPYGGYHPYPRRFGGSAGTNLEAIHSSLNAQKGSGFDASNTATLAWLENMAYARAIAFDGWGTNQRVANQWDPTRTSDMLSRWEGIFALRPGPNDSDAARRAELTLRWQRFGDLANHTRLSAELTARLGAYFVAIEYISLANANVHSPDASYPWGTQVANAPWTSTVAHILVLMQKPSGASEADFYNAAAKVTPAFDAIAPSWVTFDWYRAPDTGTPINVVGGPSQGGFYLDNNHNLDNSVFDV